LIALDAYLKMKDVRSGKRKSIDFYRDQVAKLDKKLLLYLNSVYEILHLSGYYDGLQDAKVIKRGFDVAYEIIDRIKPLNAA
ncbi:MAG: DUF5618 family protein, partial [Bacteroidales bacterium]|jgi:hypothetical protein|nr:DUF5618 family protein [Bacteroidales bacterium]